MAENEDGQERSEQATPKRHEEARKKGQVPRSREMTTMAMLLMAAVSLSLMGGHDARPIVDLDPLPGLPHFDPAADQPRGDGVAVGVHRRVALDVDDPVVQQVNLRHPQRERSQRGPLDGKQLSRRGAEVALEARVDPVAPLPGLPVGLVPALEAPAGEEVVFDEIERPLDSS